LNTPISYAITQPFARSVAQLLEQEHSQVVVSEMPKALRRRKVFVDWSQNSDYKTTIAVYSLRAKSDRPFMSLPITWEELKQLREEKAADRFCLPPKAAFVWIYRGDCGRVPSSRRASAQ
jgi:bifunctional non-homologous end joining protein LigD